MMITVSGSNRRLPRPGGMSRMIINASITARLLSVLRSPQAALTSWACTEVTEDVYAAAVGHLSLYSGQ